MPVRLADRPRAEPRCVSFRRDEHCLTGPLVPPSHPPPMNDRVGKRVRLRQSIYVRMNEPA